jgi:transposase
MGEPRLIEQAYRFALAPTPEQERFLDACAGASRFFYNWGLALVETRLRLRRAYGPSVAVPWSYKELCSEFAKVKDEVAPWRSEVVVGSQQAGLEALGAGLRRFHDGRRSGPRVGFPRYRRKGRCRESIVFQRPRILDGRRVEFDRRLGPIRSRERFTKLQRLLERDEQARIKRATVRRQGSKWYVSFTVERSPKQRQMRRPNTVVGVDVGLRHLATLSTGEQVENLRPLQGALRRLRRLQNENAARNLARLALAIAQAQEGSMSFVAATGAETQTRGGGPTPKPSGRTGDRYEPRKPIPRAILPSTRRRLSQHDGLVVRPTRSERGATAVLGEAAARSAHVPRRAARA